MLDSTSIVDLTSRNGTYAAEFAKIAELLNITVHTPNISVGVSGYAGKNGYQPLKVSPANIGCKVATALATVKPAVMAEVAVLDRGVPSDTRAANDLGLGGLGATSSALRYELVGYVYEMQHREQDAPTRDDANRLDGGELGVLL